MTPLDYWSGWIAMGVAFLVGLYVVLVGAILTAWWVVKS
jgi:hypothetical protein